MDLTRPTLPSRLRLLLTDAYMTINRWFRQYIRIALSNRNITCDLGDRAVNGNFVLLEQYF